MKKIVDAKYGNNDFQLYRDIREFLATRTDIDAVLSTTGDRWHSLMAVWAMRAGKDVYSEKPSSMTIAEGQAVVETARRYGRVYQTGTQRLSEANFVFAIELAAAAGWARSTPRTPTLRRGTPRRCATTGCPANPSRPRPSGLGPVARPVSVATLQRGVLPRRLARPLRFPHQLHRRMGRTHLRPGQAGLDLLRAPRRSHYEYVNNPTGDGMVTHFANGAKMILSRGDKYWHGSCGVRFDGPEGWVSVADGYSRAGSLESPPRWPTSARSSTTTSRAPSAR